MLTQHSLSVVPGGTGRPVGPLFPALKRWAILSRPVGLETGLSKTGFAPSKRRCIPKLSVTPGDAGWGHPAYNSEGTPL